MLQAVTGLHGKAGGGGRLPVIPAERRERRGSGVGGKGKYKEGNE